MALARIGLHAVHGTLPPALALGTLGPGRSMLVVQPEDADDAVLEALNRAIAETFAQLGRTTFLQDIDEESVFGALWRRLWGPSRHTPAAWSAEADGSQYRRISLRSPFGAAGALGTQPVELCFTSTLEVEEAARLFDFSGWHQAAQLVLLSEPGAPAPGIDDRLVARLACDKDWSLLGSLPAADRIMGAATAGVDGALMGIITLGGTAEAALSDTLTARLDAHGLAWQRHSASETAARYAGAMAHGA